SRQRAWLRSSDTLTLRLADSLRIAAARLSNLSLRKSDADAQGRAAALADAADALQRAQRGLAERSATFRESEHRDSLGYADVRAALRPGQALLAFAELAAFDREHAVRALGAATSAEDSSAREVVAFVQRWDGATPQMLRLGGRDAIAAQVSLWRQSVATSS